MRHSIFAVDREVVTERKAWTELRKELGVDSAHPAYEAARLAFDGTDASRVAMLTGLSRERLDELGGVPES